MSVFIRFCKVYINKYLSNLTASFSITFILLSLLSLSLIVYVSSSNVDFHLVSDIKVILLSNQYYAYFILINYVLISSLIFFFSYGISAYIILSVKLICTVIIYCAVKVSKCIWDIYSKEMSGDVRKVVEIDGLVFERKFTISELKTYISSKIKEYNVTNLTLDQKKDLAILVEKNDINSIDEYLFAAAKTNNIITSVDAPSSITTFFEFMNNSSIISIVALILSFYSIYQISQLGGCLHNLNNDLKRISEDNIEKTKLISTLQMEVTASTNLTNETLRECLNVTSIHTTQIINILKNIEK